MFIEEIAIQVQVGYGLVNDIAQMITDCMLPTMETDLQTFIEHTVKLLLRLNRGMLTLDYRVQIFTLPYKSQ